MSFRLVASGLAVFSFIVTFLISSWEYGLFQRTGADRRAPPIHDTRIPGSDWPVTAPPEGSTQHPRLDASRSTPGQNPGIVASSPAQHAATHDSDDGPPDTSQEIVPVRLSFGHNSDSSSLTASLRNQSATSLSVKVAALNPLTGNESVVQVDLPPSGAADLSSMGLVIEHGSQVTIDSPPYRARLMRAE